MRSRRKHGAVVIFLSLLTGVALGGFFWWQWAKQPVNIGVSTQKLFVIRKGEALNSVSSRLKEDDLIRSSFVFRLLVLSKGLSKRIQAGDFRLHQGMGLEETVSQLTHGTLDIWVTLLEGWRSEEIATELIESGFNIDIGDWRLEIGDSSFEGYLFPDTYLFPKEASQGAAIKIMRDNFDQRVNSLMREKMTKKGLTLHQVITLASIVEREARSSADRPIVAGILIKRWQNNWPLQADATVQYALAAENCQLGTVGCNWWPKNLTKQDLQIDSAYNTYKYKGLPSGPICNPGLESIKTVIDYQETPYWFYLSDLKGKIHYARTVEEHNANIVKYLKK